VLDVAPSAQVTPVLERLRSERLVRIDLGADNRRVDVLGSLTDLPLADDSVDLMVCYHVLEHIPDDRRAMREIARVLRPHGMAILQVPWRPGTVTDEDPGAPEAERRVRFGQADHVRFYGDDFEDRLVQAGLGFHRVTPRTLLGDAMSGLLKLVPTETCWLATPDANARVPPLANGQRTELVSTLETLVGELESLHADLATARTQSKSLQRRLDRLEAAPPAVMRRWLASHAPAPAKAVARSARALARDWIQSAKHGR
jgi:SAM-dependent methyltransferase